MKRVIFLFLDGVGLGPADPTINPLAVDRYPTLRHLLAGQPAVATTGRLSTPWAELVPTDAQLGLPGRPQSATGQAALLTGVNAPQQVGEHYGPRPDARVRAILATDNLFHRLFQAGLHPFFCNGYPRGYFDAINRGKRLLSAVPFAATISGLALPTADDIYAGRALAADFTNAGWRDQLGYADVPVLTPTAAGAHLWQLAQPYDFVFFEHWQTDVLGHAADRSAAIENFERFDGFLGGLLNAADLAETLIIVSSDHGNVEDCSHGKHTENPVLTLVLGAERQRVAAQVHDLTDFAPLIEAFLTEP
ncbi:MAG: alkaline phosphatase family protein [Caldilineaceae bacterium]|nr:alkaline phosphatase family protein [Caldilineaceae bacterium]